LKLDHFEQIAELVEKILITLTEEQNEENQEIDEE